jgi:hypothetical protein
MLTRFEKAPAAIMVLLVGSVIFPSESQARVSEKKLLGNLTYFTGSGDVPKLNLIDGSRTAWYGRCNVSLNLEGHFCFGDFNRDGLRDAAVVIVGNEGGNLDDYSLAFLINDGTRLVHRNSVHLDFWAIINYIWQRDGKVLVDLFVHQEGDCNAGPTKRVKRVFDYRDLGPDTLVPVVQKSERAPSGADLRYVDRNQEIQDICDTGIPARIRKAFDRQDGAIFAQKFMVVEVAPIDPGSFQAIILFEGIPHPFWARFLRIKNGYVLCDIEELPNPLGEMFLDETRSLAYERFWM